MEGSYDLINGVLVNLIYMNVKKYAVLMSFFLLSFAVKAQKDSLDYSYLNFNKLYDYFSNKKISLLSSYTPDLFFEAFDWLGTPYHFGGKSKNGIDCSAFVSQVFRKVFGITLLGSCRDIYQRCTTINKEELTEGDLVFFNIRGKYLSHIGIYLQNNKFIHASVHGGVIVDDLDSPYYKNYFYKAARIVQ